MAPALSLGACFFKAHGHGNDYLVFEEGHAWSVTREAVHAVCDRTRGVGGDGIVALLGPGIGPGEPVQDWDERDCPHFHLRMFNPDGSEFERSGNGLRILGAYVMTRGLVEPGRPFLVSVGGGTVTMEILGAEPEGLLNIAVEMGEARFGIDAVGADRMAFGSGPTLEGPGGEVLEIHPVSMGNPHCVVVRESLREEELLELGPFLTSHASFPAGTNVQLAEVVGPREVEILIWERGVGRTTSSGTSACAAASACVEAGLLQPGGIRVGMEGGNFLVTVSPEKQVRLEGPVQPILQGELSGGFLGTLATLG